MPYKRYNKRRRYRKRGGYMFYRRFRNKTRSAYRMARKALFLTNAEKKESIVSSTLTPSNAWQQVHLNSLVQGDNKITRIGNSVKMINFYLKLKGTINSSATHTTIRWFVLLDKQPNAGIPTDANLFDNTTNILSTMNTSNGYRFRIIKKGFMILNITSIQEKVNNVFKRKVIHFKYGANVGDYTDLRTNSMWFYYLCDEATNTPTLLFWYKWRFLDN